MTLGTEIILRKWKILSLGINSYDKEDLSKKSLFKKTLKGLKASFKSMTKLFKFFCFVAYIHIMIYIKMFPFNLISSFSIEIVGA